MVVERIGERAGGNSSKKSRKKMRGNHKKSQVAGENNKKQNSLEEKIYKSSSRRAVRLPAEGKTRVWGEQLRRQYQEQKQGAGRASSK